MAIKFEPKEDFERDPGDEGAGSIHREKADWHRKRAGKLRNASIKAVGKHTYAAGLLDEGVAHHHPDHPEHDDHSDMSDRDFAFNP